jgi:hypothetical protein
MSDSAPRRIIADIAFAIERSSSIHFTGVVIEQFIDQINGVIKWLYSPEADTQKFKIGRDVVLTHLREAHIQFSVAVAEYQRKDFSAKTLNSIEAGRRNLIRALDAW